MGYLTTLALSMGRTVQADVASRRSVQPSANIWFDPATADSVLRDPLRAVTLGASLSSSRNAHATRLQGDDHRQLHLFPRRVSGFDLDNSIHRTLAGGGSLLAARSLKDSMLDWQVRAHVGEAQSERFRAIDPENSQMQLFESPHIDSAFG